MGAFCSVSTDMDRHDTASAIHWYQSLAYYPTGDAVSRMLCWLRWFTRPCNDRDDRRIDVFPYWLDFIGDCSASASANKLTEFAAHAFEVEAFKAVVALAVLGDIPSTAKHVIVLYKQKHLNKWTVIDSNSPTHKDLSDPNISDPAYARWHLPLKTLFEASPCPEVVRLRSFKLRQTSLEETVSRVLQAETEGTCALCALATVCFVLLYAPNDLCNAWERLLDHARTEPGEASIIRFVLSTLRLMRTLYEPATSPVLVCHAPMTKGSDIRTAGIALDLAYVTNAVNQRVAQRGAENQYHLKSKPHLEGRHGFDIGFTFDTGKHMVGELNQWTDAEIELAIGNGVFCVALYHSAERMCSRSHELLHFEHNAFDHRRRLQREVGTLKLQLELLRTDYDQRLQLLNDENEYLHGCITLFRDQGDQGVYSGTKKRKRSEPLARKE